MTQNGTLLIDGSMGQGGGQILRTCLALSLCRGIAVRVENIRRDRPRPGLMPQHLVAVRAAAEISAAQVEGAELGSRVLTFRPGPVRAGSYRFDIGTAGSTTLVLQTVLPALLDAEDVTELVIQGGTHNPLAPPYDFVERAFLPLLRRMGAKVDITLARPGFYPVGGGIVRVQVQPVRALAPLELVRPGARRRLEARALVSRLPRHIAERELAVLHRELAIPAAALRVRAVGAPGPGNAVMVDVVWDNVTEVFTAIGRKGVPAEVVAEEVVVPVRRYLRAGVPVGQHLADQLLVPLALAGGGVFVSLTPTGHTRTNAEVIRRFLDVWFAFQELGEDCWRIACS